MSKSIFGQAAVEVAEEVSLMGSKCEECNSVDYYVMQDTYFADLTAKCLYCHNQLVPEVFVHRTLKNPFYFDCESEEDIKAHAKQIVSDSSTEAMGFLVFEYIASENFGEADVWIDRILRKGRADVLWQTCEAFLAVGDLDAVKKNYVLKVLKERAADDDIEALTILIEFTGRVEYGVLDQVKAVASKAVARGDAAMLERCAYICTQIEHNDLAIDWYSAAGKLGSNLGYLNVAILRAIQEDLLTSQHITKQLILKMSSQKRKQADLIGNAWELLRSNEVKLWPSYCATTFTFSINGQTHHLSASDTVNGIWPFDEAIKQVCILSADSYLNRENTFSSWLDENSYSWISADAQNQMVDLFRQSLLIFNPDIDAVIAFAKTCFQDVMFLWDTTSFKCVSLISGGESDRGWTIT